MQKFYYSILFLLAILLSSGCEMNNPMYQTPKMVIKSETKWRVDVVSESKIEKVWYKTFNTEGRITLKENYNESGDLLQRIRYVYRSSLTIENVTTYENGFPVADKVFSYLHDVNGNITERITTDANGDTSAVTKYKYDSHGNVIEELRFDGLGNFTGSIEYIYNYNGNGYVTGSLVNDNLSNGFRTRDSIIYKPNENMVEQIKFGTTGQQEFVYTYIYDNQGFIIKEYHSTQKGEVIRKYIYEYTYY